MGLSNMVAMMPPSCVSGSVSFVMYRSADVREQYEKVAEYLSEVPENVSVVLSPGNHDPVRLAEPQPAIPEDIGGSLIDQGVTLVGGL